METQVAELDFGPIIEALQSAITPSQLITIIAATIGVGAAFVLLHFGYRKIKGGFTSGLFKGKFGR